MRSAEGAAALDAVTIDAAGTLLELADPTEGLRLALAAHGVERGREAVAAAFAAEVAYYVPRSHEGADAASLARLRREAVAVFLEHAGAAVPPDEFVPAFLGALEFRPAAGALAALSSLRGAGLALACVSNWDAGLGDQLDRAGVGPLLDAAVSSAEAGAPKPGAQAFLLALERLGVAPERALHVGDDQADREGARAAGLAFEPAPLATLPARLGLGGGR